MFKKLKIRSQVGIMWVLALAVILMLSIGFIGSTAVIRNEFQSFSDVQYRDIISIWETRCSIYKATSTESADDLQVCASTILRVIGDMSIVYEQTHGYASENMMHMLELAESCMHLDFQEAQPLLEEIDGILSKMMVNLDADANAAVADATRVANVSLVTSIIYLIISVVLFDVIGLSLIRNLKPINRIVETAEQVAAGDYGAELTYTSGNELGKLADAFRSMIASNRACIRAVSTCLCEASKGNLTLRRSEVEFPGEFAILDSATRDLMTAFSGMVSDVQSAVANVTSGADQVAAGAVQLSQGATEQASTLEELSASVADLNDRVGATAASANEAAQLTVSANDRVGESRQQMGELMSAMQRINDATTNIDRIVKTIDDIAFQTNILALNAAIEAARAGAAGKGFAVVADEVRNLAAKSADSVRTTTELIQQVQSAISEGMVCAERTYDTLEGAVSQMAGATNNITSISVATGEQSAALRQLAIGVEQVSAVVQGNSATSEESAAASEILAKQAAMLQERVAVYKL